MNGSPESLGEVGRMVDALRRDLNSRLDTMNMALNGLVSRELYQTDMTYMRERMAALERENDEVRKEQEADRQRRIGQRNWLIAAVLLPLLLFVGQWFLTTRGVAP